MSGLTNWNQILRIHHLIWAIKFNTVHSFTLEDKYWVVISNSTLKETSGIITIPNWEDFETWDSTVDRGIAVGMLGGYSNRWSIRTSEDNGTVGISCWHIGSFGSIVNDLWERLSSEVKSHKFNDWSKSVVSCSNSEGSKSDFSDRCINNSFITEFFPESIRNLVCTVILSYFLTHKKDVFISPQLISHCGSQGLTQG